MFVKEAPVASASAPLEVADARAVERWDASERRWRPLEGKASLAPGSLVRGSGKATLALGTRRLRLSPGVYVVSERRTLEPLPGEEVAVAPSPSPPARLSVSDEASEAVPRLLALRATGLPEEQARAQQELERWYEKLGDPGPSLLNRISAYMTTDAGAPRKGPPATADAWLAWWKRVRP